VKRRHPDDARIFSASRTEGRDTPNISASSRSGGSLSPGANSPARIEVRIWSAICVETFFGFIGLKFMGCSNQNGVS